MILRSSDIDKLDKYYRINLINQLSGVKGANLIGSVSGTGLSNVAIFNSVIHIGANPASVGFVLRPLTVARHTYSNIMETGFYTINQVSSSFIDKAHQTSGKYAEGISEFTEVGLQEEYLGDFMAPYVGESKIRMGVSFVEKHEIALNGTVLMVGKIEELVIEDGLIESTGHLDLDAANAMGVAGLDTYYGVKKRVRKGYVSLG